MLGHGFWKAEFGGRTDVLGQTLQVHNVSATIVGVAPAGFVGIDDHDPPALFMPIMLAVALGASASPAARAAKADPNAALRAE